MIKQNLVVAGVNIKNYIMAFLLKDKNSLFGIHEMSTSNTPIFVKKLDGSIAAEANRDGTIFVDKNMSDKQIKKAIAHEKVHLDQMAQGKLNYTDDVVTWKKDTRSPARVYKREDMMEGAKELPWEKEAYDKTKHIK